jgi:hypothetical protein
MIRVVHDDQTTNWEQIFLTLEGEARNPFLFSSTPPNTFLGVAYQPPPAPPPPPIYQLEAERRRQFENSEHRIRARLLEHHTIYVYRIIMPSDGEYDQGIIELRKMMEREKGMEISVQMTRTMTFVQAIHIRHINGKSGYTRFATFDGPLMNSPHLAAIVPSCTIVPTCSWIPATVRIRAVMLACAAHTCKI